MEMTYREFYWRKTKEQLSLCWTIFWNGVIRNKGHHSEWNKKTPSWFYRGGK